MKQYKGEIDLALHFISQIVNASNVYSTKIAIPYHINMSLELLATTVNKYVRNVIFP